MVESEFTSQHASSTTISQASIYIVHQICCSYSAYTLVQNIKSSTPIIRQPPPSSQTNPAPLPTFPSFSNGNRPRIRLSQLLYDPARPTEYLSEIEEKHDSDSSQQSLSIDGSDSCYDSMSEHRNDQMNLSKMNVSMDIPRDTYGRHQPRKMLKLPNSLDSARFHSTAIEEMGHY